MRGRHAVWVAAAFALAACDGGGGGNPLGGPSTKVDEGRYTLVELNGFTPDRPEWPVVARSMGHMLASTCGEGSTSNSLKLTGATAEITGGRLVLTLNKEEVCITPGVQRPRWDRTPTVISGRIGPRIDWNWDDIGQPPDPHEQPPTPGHREFSVFADDGTYIFRGGTWPGGMALSRIGNTETSTGMLFDRE